MTAKDRTERPGKAIRDTIEEAKDATREAGHRVAAEGEHLKRDVAGDEMTTSQKVGSVAKEAKHRTQAEIDAAKRHTHED